MKTLEMEVALMRQFNPRQQLIVPNVGWGMHRNFVQLHECDLLVLSKRNYATEVEIKISKSDLLKDCEKGHGHDHNLIARLYFAVPEKLAATALECIPDRAGLIVVKQRNNQYRHRYVVDVIKSPKRNAKAFVWTESERAQLLRLGCLRILGMKEKILKLQ